MDCDCLVNKTEEEKLLLQFACQKPSDNSSKIPYSNCFKAIRAFEVLQSFRENEVFCDIKLETDDGIIVYGHKVVLASATPYFCAMFTNFEESKKDHVFLRELDSTALQLIVDYIYTARIVVTKDNVKVLLHAADLLQIHDVRYACCEFLKTQLRPTNCLGFKELVSQYRCVELLPSFENYIHQHFSEVIECDEFLSSPYESVVELISSDKLQVSSEEKIFECVIEWVNYNDSDSRKIVLPKLMEHVRLPLVSKEYLLNRVKEEPLLKNSVQCRDYIIDALSFHVLKDENPDTIPKQNRFKHRQLVKTVNDLSVVQSNPILYHSAGVLNNHLYLVGGYNLQEKQYLDSVVMYCSILGTWTSVKSMHTSRFGAGVGVLNDVLYAVGGCNESKNLKCVEVYIPSADTWSFVSSMRERRKFPVVFALDGLLYVVGGHSGTNKYLTTAEMYNPKTDTWIYLTDVKQINNNYF